MQLTGILNKIFFHREGFLIGRLDNGQGIKGSMARPELGMSYEFEGEIETSQRHGETFVFESYRAVYPTEEKAIRRYLMKRAKWIGPTTFEKLWKAYGVEIMNTLKDDPQRVADEITGITLTRANEISSMLRENEVYEKFEIELNHMFADTHVGSRVQREVLEYFIAKNSNDPLAALRENPYQLTQFSGISFERADRVALNLGFPQDSPKRHVAYIEHLVDENHSFGHTYMSYDDLSAKFFNFFSDSLKYSYIEESKALSYLLDDLTNMDKVGRRRVMMSEIYIAYNLGQRIDKGQQEVNLLTYPGTLNRLQLLALTTALREPVMILTGPPGTGKTYTVNAIVQKLTEMYQGCAGKIALVAPTGKAAKRLQEQTGRTDSCTIHRFLGCAALRDHETDESDYDEEFKITGFIHGASNPILGINAVIVDESSMVDVELFSCLLKALPVETKIILVGDHYQLPSVGPGNILRDIIESKAVPVVELEAVQRQSEGLIVDNCHRIKSGKDIIINNKKADFQFSKHSTQEEIKKQILSILTPERIGKKVKDIVWDVQVLSPSREKTDLSCRALNVALQEQLNPLPDYVCEQERNYRFRTGDKVINCKNDYPNDIINGDMGRVAYIDFSEKVIYVDFVNPARRVALDLYKNSLELGYVVTVHKYQGSEAPAVIIPVHKCFGHFLNQRNLLYTAISRAKQLCVLVGDRNAVGKTIQRNNNINRNSRLKELLQA